jgi:hypothetical protein
MFAHQVIEDLQSSIKRMELNIHDKERFKFYIESKKNVIKFIQKAQHFYIGDESLQLNGSISQSLKGSPIFQEKVKLPYHVCTFSAHHLEDLHGNDDVQYNEYKRKNNIIEWKSSKRFILAMQLSEDVIALFLCCFMDKIKSWILQELSYTVDFNFDPYRRIGGHWLINPPSGLEMQQKIKEDQDDFSVVYLTLLLLGCKNITTEKIIPSAKLNLKRVRSGKLPIFDYKILNVFIPGNKKNKQDIDKQEPIFHNRIHLCRGHFKEYTEERPLFGFLTGRYWWQPSVRGRNRSGIVIKDYSVTMNQEGKNEISQL